MDSRYCWECTGEILCISFSKGEFHMTYILTALVVFVIGWQFHKFLENSTKK